MWIQLLTLSSFIYLVLIIYVGERAKTRVNRLLLLVMATSFLWPALYLVEVVAESLSAMVTITGIRVALTPLVPFFPDALAAPHHGLLAKGSSLGLGEFERVGDYPGFPLTILRHL